MIDQLEHHVINCGYGTVGRDPAQAGSDRTPGPIASHEPLEDLSAPQAGVGG